MANTVTLTGSVFRLETGATKSGKSILRFNLSYWQGKNTDGSSDYGNIRVTAFGPLALNASTIAEKDHVIVSGRLRENKWTDKEGNKRYTTELIADEIGQAYSTFGGNDAAGGGEDIPF